MKEKAKMESVDNPGGAPAEKNGGNGGRKKSMALAITVLCLAGMFFGARWFIHRINYTSTDDAQVDADIVPVSFKVPGRIREISVSEGDTVRRGDALAVLDDTDYRLAVEQAEARLESEKRELDKAEAALALTMERTRIGVMQSSAGLRQVEGSAAITSTQEEVNLERLEKEAERAEIGLKQAGESYAEALVVREQAARDLERVWNLYREGVASRDQYEKARLSADSAAARLAQAEQRREDARKNLELATKNLDMAKVDRERTKIARRDTEKAGLSLKLSKTQMEKETRIAEAGVEALRARVASARTAVEQARAALVETTAASPADGIVAKKTAQVSEVVQAGKPVVFIVDRSSLKVIANIEETKIRNVRPGLAARITVDAYPGREFRGKVKTVGAAANSKFALIPQSNPTGQFIKTTQRIPVKIALEGDVSPLKPGMNVIVSIKNKQ